MVFSKEILDFFRKFLKYPQIPGNRKIVWRPKQFFCQNNFSYFQLSTLAVLIFFVFAEKFQNNFSGINNFSKNQNFSFWKKRKVLLWTRLYCLFIFWQVVVEIIHKRQVYKGLDTAFLPFRESYFYQGFIRVSSTGESRHRNLINTILFQYYLLRFRESSIRIIHKRQVL